MQPQNMGLCMFLLALGVCGSVQSFDCYSCTFRTLTNGQTEGDFCKSSYQDGARISCAYGCTQLSVSATINGIFRSPGSVGRGCAARGQAPGCRSLTTMELRQFIDDQSQDSTMSGKTCTCHSDLCNTAPVFGTAVGLLLVSVLIQMLVIG